MSTSKVTYLGHLRAESTHLQSGDTFLTDAPTDNNGKGEAFSPTDTIATGLASCMLTVMGLKAKQMDVSLKGATAAVTKIMANDPRRISKIEIALTFPAGISKKDRAIFERVAASCPVHHSLHPDIVKDISFNWGE